MLLGREDLDQLFKDERSESREFDHTSYETILKREGIDPNGLFEWAVSFAQSSKGTMEANSLGWSDAAPALIVRGFILGLRAAREVGQQQ